MCGGIVDVQVPSAMMLVLYITCSVRPSLYVAIGVKSTVTPAITELTLVTGTPPVVSHALSHLTC